MLKQTVTFSKITAAFLAGLFIIDQAGGLPDFSRLPLKDSTIMPAAEMVVAHNPAPASNARHALAGLQPTETGNYLAGRFAQRQNDWKNAQVFMERALGMTDKTQLEKTGLLDRTFLLALTNGNIDTAVGLASDIITREENGELAYIVVAMDFFKKGDYAAAEKTLEKIDTDVFGGYAVPLLKAWTLAASGTHDLTETLSPLVQSSFANDPAFNFHQALIYDLNGDIENAKKYYTLSLHSGLDLNETLMAANFFERAENTDTAEKIYTVLLQKDPENDYIQAAMTRLEKGEKPLPHIATAREGMIYSLFSMAHLLYSREAADSALIYSRIAEYLDVDRDYLNMLIGDILAHNHHYDEALAYYATIKPAAVLYKSAQLKQVGILQDAGRTDDAFAFLTSLQNNQDIAVDALIQTGDLYQQEGKFEEAVKAYDSAIVKIGDDFNSKRWWGLMYARGMAQERLGNWSAAEKDLMAALEHSPNNPSILNYLGYSWVEKGIHLDRAFHMLKQAIAIKPNDGYILDSYGWAFYKLGQYEQAVSWLEKAVEIHPEDVTLNDHLGDAYWQDGRKKEARFQWERARKYSPDPIAQEKFAQKLKFGLTAPETDAAAIVENKEAHLIQ